MAGAKENLFTGTTIVFGTSAFAADLMGASVGGISRAAIPTSHAGTSEPGAGKYGNMTFIPAALSNPGELTMEIAHDPDQEVPIDQPAETITFTFAKLAADASAAIETFSGFCTAFDFTGALEDKYTATMTIQRSGEVTQTAAA